jgi:hypothetical protein
VTSTFSALTRVSAQKAFVLYRTTVRTVLERNKRREAEIKKALRQEATRHEAAVKSMHRLRALRLQHDKKAKGT